MTNSIGMKFVQVPAGSFLMGSPPSEPGRKSDEGPLHTVLITKPFYIAVTQVTQYQFEKIMGQNPASKSHIETGRKADHPVDYLSWNQAIAFCQKLSEFPDEKKQKHAYRLPTEAEWEYACRAGTTTPFSFGTYLTFSDANAVPSDEKGNPPNGTMPVGSYPPNAFGIFDMHGNVNEWCADWYGMDYYAVSPSSDPLGPREGTKRILRGGRWGCLARACRSADRNSTQPGNAMTGIGFRVVLEI